MTRPDASVKSEAHTPLPGRMRAALEGYQRRVFVIKIAEGLLAGVFGLLLSYLVVLGADRLFDAPALLRAAILVAGSVTMAVLFPLKFHNWAEPWHRTGDEAGAAALSALWRSPARHCRVGAAGLRQRRREPSPCRGRHAAGR